MKKKTLDRRVRSFILISIAAMLLVTVLFCMTSCGSSTAGTAVETNEAGEEVAKYTTANGIWETIAIPFGWIIRVCYNLIPNYVVALAIFAIIMKVILFPFGIKQQKNSMKQASLRPKEQAIRKKYAGRNDQPTQQKMQQEIMDLYQKENFNPMGGCLPLLIQFPILFALFSVIRNPLRYITGLGIDELNKLGQKMINLGYNIKVGYGDIEIVKELSAHPEAFDKIQGISDKLTSASDLPNLTLFGLDLAPTPELAFQPLIIIPILTFIVAFVTMRLTKKLTYQPEQVGDAKTSGIVMDLLMPVLSTWFTFMYPAVLGIYFLFQNILGVVQQYVLKKMYPVPVFTEEDYKKAEQEILGKNQSKKKKSNGPAKRHPNSLHHIDDDDDENVEMVEPKKPEPKKESGLIAPAPLKDEDNDGSDDETDGKE